MYSLESKVALVTGAGGEMGMGRAIALHGKRRTPESFGNYRYV